MSAQNSAGIQTLLEAEKEAQAIVQKARQYRVQRLKDARSEAVAEIEKYRKEKDQQLEKFNEDRKGANKAEEIDAEKSVAKQLKQVESETATNREKVIETLTKAVLTPEYSLHINA